MSDAEATLIDKARELKKLEAKRTDAVKAEETRQAEAAKKLAAIDADIVKVRGEIGAIVAPPA